ncbi:hypothetical protein L6270_04915 [Candidatus Parcubacteria bacterium]|nr:hypothetical protein [Patescibacteria group bacterium]MBU4309302.1 hypothetical protein [Patescibacteria group bacterium]MBU4432279.1 hypothetical protein [Patescibacteria group bacterium]MBU4577663.1 hypothetical protein [Patescibacteria group bacterium]MCG2697349.1 hypothetical protein [Candidatus Parcubacteria bacterium]
MYNKIAQFSLSSKKANNINDIFVAQPDFNIEKIAGKLFIVMEIDTTYKNTPKIINFLNNTINSNYYQNEKIILREKISTLKIEHIFEASLTKTNKQFTEFLEREKIDFDFDTINATVGVIHENDIHFANTGKNKILLVYKNLKKEKESPLISEAKKEEYKISEVSKHIIRSKDDEENNEKLFSNVISGKIPARGNLIVCNEALPEYFSNKQLIDTVATLPPVPAVTQIKNYLSALNVYTSFYGIIIKNTSLDPEEPRPSTRLMPNTNNSISQLNKTENETEGLLSPGNIFSQIKLPTALNLFLNRRKSSSSANHILLKDKIFFRKKNFTILKKLWDYVKNFFIYTGHLITHLTKNLFNNDKPKKLIKQIAIFFKVLNIKNKILLALFFFFIALFVSNSIYLKTKNQKQEAQIDYKILTAEIEQKQNQIDATLLYNNDNGAKKLFSELEVLIGQLPQKSPEDNQNYLKFKTKIDAQMEKIRKITKIDKPVEIANFSKLNANAQTKNITFVPDDKQGIIYGTDPIQKSIYTINVKENSATIFTPKESINILNLLSPSKNGENLIYYLNDKSIIEFDPGKNTLSEIAIEEKALDNLVSAEAYGDKMYLFNKNGEIIRYTKKGKTFASAYLWNQNNTADLKDAIGISIEGNIFALSATGSIIKLARGEKVDFPLEQIDPPFSNPTKIYASPSLKFLYILEPSQKRLAVFDKDGKFLAQYKFDSLENVADFAIDEKNKKLYLLNNNSVFSATTNHF